MLSGQACLPEAQLCVKVWQTAAQLAGSGHAYGWQVTAQCICKRARKRWHICVALRRTKKQKNEEAEERRSRRTYTKGRQQQKQKTPARNSAAQALAAACKLK